MESDPQQRTKDLNRFEISFLPDFDDSTLLAELQRVAGLVSSEVALTQTEFKRRGARVSASTLQRRFGGWKEALQAAGLENRYVGTKVSPKMKLQRAKQFTNEQLLEELRRVHELIKTDYLTRDEFNSNSSVSDGVIRFRFGSFKKGLELAGLASHPSSNRGITPEQCFENLASVWTYHGRAPHFREMWDAPSVIKGRAYELRWKTWRKALSAFVVWANDDLESTENAVAPLAQPVVSFRPSVAISADDRREVKPALRFRVFKRDHFRCVACGRSPSTHFGVDLHADHIRAFANGGKTNLENLQTLCQNCNLGKGRS